MSRFTWSLVSPHSLPPSPACAQWTRCWGRRASGAGWPLPGPRGWPWSRRYAPASLSPATSNSPALSLTRTSLSSVFLYVSSGPRGGWLAMATQLSRSKPHILAVAPSNVAVDNMIQRIMDRVAHYLLPPAAPSIAAYNVPTEAPTWSVDGSLPSSHTHHRHRHCHASWTRASTTVAAGATTPASSASAQAPR